MALPNVIQTVGTATTTAAPASISATIAATAQGSTLVAVVAVAASAAPTAAAPGAAWVATLSIIQGTTIAIFMYHLPGAANPGGITTVASNLTNVNGACLDVFEVGNLNSAQPQDTGVTASNAGSVSPLVLVPGNPRLAPEIYIAAIANIASQTFADTSIADRSSWTTAPAAQASTTGATNVQLNARYGLPGANPSGIGQMSATLGGSAAWCAVMASFYCTSGGAVARGIYGAEAVGALAGMAGVG